MRILVTGGAGYIGAILCPALLEAGHEVILLDSLMFGVQPILHFINHPKLQVVHGDVREPRIVTPLTGRVDAVLHLAAIVGSPACAADPTTAETTNVDGTRILVDSLSTSQALVYASTGSTYGQCETVATEETPINPLTLCAPDFDMASSALIVATALPIERRSSPPAVPVTTTSSSAAAAGSRSKFTVTGVPLVVAVCRCVA